MRAPLPDRSPHGPSPGRCRVAGRATFGAGTATRRRAGRSGAGDHGRPAHVGDPAERTGRVRAGATTRRRRDGRAFPGEREHAGPRSAGSAAAAALRRGPHPPRRGPSRRRLASGALREPAPRPATDVRVQSRFAAKAKNAQLFGGAEYLSRGDFYNSPGVRVGAHLLPAGVARPRAAGLALLELAQRRGGAGEDRRSAALPDSHAPAWLVLAGGRYSIGYGKLMVGGLGGAIHFEPQAFIHAGLHAHDGDVGPSGDGGLGLLVFLTPKVFVRIDAAIVFEREDRSGSRGRVWGTLPSLGVGGTL